MIINKYWYLNKHERATRKIGRSHFKAAQKQFDNVAIYYTDERNFKPIVFGEYAVKSYSSWTVKQFYQALTKWIDCYFTRDTHYISYSYNIFIDSRSKEVRWGCRYFSLEDICTMMEIMEYYYTDAELKK